MVNFLQLIIAVYFNALEPPYIALRILYMLGAWGLLKKSGLKPAWALVPWACEYQLSRCANREPEGRVYSLTGVAISFLTAAEVYLRQTRNISLSVLVLPLLMSVAIMRTIYTLRVFSGFVEVYGVKKTWLILCIFDSTVVIPMFVWGYDKRYHLGVRKMHRKLRTPDGKRPQGMSCEDRQYHCKYRLP